MTAESAPAAFWAAIRAEVARSPAVAVAQAISWLPPVRIPVAALHGVGEPDGAPGSVARLRRLGLIDVAAGDVTMHRLFRSAVRESALRDDAPGQVTLVHGLLHDDRAAQVLERAADLEAARLMGTLLQAAPDAEVTASGVYKLGELFERHGTADDSAAWYRTFLQLAGGLDGGDVPDAQRLPVVHALVGMARAAVRGLSVSVAETRRPVADGVGWAERAERLCHGRTDMDYRRAGSHAKAMRGLLLRKLASQEPGDSPASLELLLQAERALRDSYHERREQFEDPATSPELDRSQFNLAGLEVRLAQRDNPANAGGHLDQALRHYTEVLEARRKRYRTDDLEEVICCVNGQAIVHYYRAVFLPGTWQARIDQLRSAAALADEAATVRQRLAGPVDDQNTAKSVTLQAKIALMRLAAIEAAGVRADRADAAIKVFGRERQTLIDNPPPADPGE